MIPKYHMIEYKTHKIYYVSGSYRIDDQNTFYISLDDAKHEVDKLFDNLNELNDKNQEIATPPNGLRD